MLITYPWLRCCWAMLTLNQGLQFLMLPCQWVGGDPWESGKRQLGSFPWLAKGYSIPYDVMLRMKTRGKAGWGQAGHWSVGGEWLFFICITLFFFLLSLWFIYLFVIFLFIKIYYYYFISIIKLSLSQHIRFFTFTFLIFFPHSTRAGEEWESSCVMLSCLFMLKHDTSIE